MLDVIIGGWVGQKYNVNLTFGVAPWVLSALLRSSLYGMVQYITVCRYLPVLKLPSLYFFTLYVKCSPKDTFTSEENTKASLES